MLKLKTITGRNVWDILGLKVAEEQRHFVAGNDESLIEAYIAITANGHAFPFGIYDGDTPVGFLMIGFGTDDDWPDPPAIAAGNYNLWRLMIDGNFHYGAVFIGMPEMDAARIEVYQTINEEGNNA